MYMRIKMGRDNTFKIIYFGQIKATYNYIFENDKTMRPTDSKDL